MNRQVATSTITAVGVLFGVAYTLFFLPALAEQPIPLRQAIPGTSALTLSGAVHVVQVNYPKLLQARSEMRVAVENVKAQRAKEYVPELLTSYQSVVASHNRLTQTLFGSSVLPTTPGPGPDTVTLKPDVFGAAGFLASWDPIDFGLHKARIDSAKADSALAGARFGATVLEAEVEAAKRYLDATVKKEQIRASEANVDRFADFSKVVHAQVRSGLQPEADASLADAQLANARNDLIRDQLNYDLAKAALGEAIGLGGQSIEINPGRMVIVTKPQVQETPLVVESHPLAVEARNYVSTFAAQRQVLSKQYFPRFRWLAGMNFRGTTFLTNRGDVPAKDISAVLPYVPNFNMGMIVDWTPSDIVKIRFEKRVIDARSDAARHGYDAVVQALRTQNLSASIKVKAAMELAANIPVQVSAADVAAQQAQARYQAGLTTVAQVTEANRLLAESRVKLAVANVGVWRALLDEAAVRGNLRSFLAEADRATAGGL